MDNGDGTFRKINSTTAAEMQRAMPQTNGVFCVGEQFDLRGSRFEICSIGRKKMKIKLLKKKI